MSLKQTIFIRCCSEVVIGELWNIQVGRVKLGEVSFGMLKLGELGEVSFGIYQLCG